MQPAETQGKLVEKLRLSLLLFEQEGRATLITALIGFPHRRCEAVPPPGTLPPGLEAEQVAVTFAAKALLAILLSCVSSLIFSPEQES